MYFHTTCGVGRGTQKGDKEEDIGIYRGYIPISRGIYIIEDTSMIYGINIFYFYFLINKYLYTPPWGGV